MGRSKSVPSRRQDTETIVGAAALANSSSLSSLASPSHLSAHNNDRRLAICGVGASSVEQEQHPPSTLDMAMAATATAASGQQKRISPTSPARSRFSDGSAATSASAIVTPEKEGKKSLAKRKSRSASSSGNRPRLRRVAFAETEHTSRDPHADHDDDDALFDEAPTCRRGGGISGRMIIDDDDVDIEGGTSATSSDVKRRIYFDEEDEEEGAIEKTGKGNKAADLCIDDSAEVRIVQKEDKTFIYVASPPPGNASVQPSSSNDDPSHELLRLRLSGAQIIFFAGSNSDTGNARGPIALSSVKAVESLIQLWADQSSENEPASCDIKPLDIAAICRAFDSNLFEILLGTNPSTSSAHVSIRLSQACFDMCCASQLSAPPIPVPRKLPGNADQYSKPHPSYTLMLALGTIFKGSVLEDVAASLVKGLQKSKARGAGDHGIITAKMVYSAVDNFHASECEAVPETRMNIHGLVPTLRPYQEAAVKWMLKREGKGDNNGDDAFADTEWELSWVVMKGPLFATSFGIENGIKSDIVSLTEWRETKKISSTDDSESAIFCNAFTGWIVSTYDEAKSMTIGHRDGASSSGGLLGESMGLGKSVETIGVILANPCPSGVYAAYLPGSINTTDEAASNGTDSPIDDENLTAVHDEKRQRTNDSSSQHKKKVKSTKPPALRDAVCVCGRSSNYDGCLSWVVCSLCGEALHGRCAGFASEEMLLTSTKAGDRARVCSSNRCPSCVAAQGHIIKSRATLIVTPPAILAQWQSEIVRHTLDPQTGRPLKVMVYPGMRELCSLESSKPHAHFSLVHPRILADADVILMSFSSLMGDLSHSDDNPFAGLGRSSKSGAGSRLRSRKRYRVIPSPLSSIHFWRVCLDEAQKVETPTTASAIMARKLAASHRWCISGTPVGRGKLDDLFGLLLFLQTPKPFDDLRWFKSSFLLSQGDALNRLSHLLQNVMWRSTKDNDAVRRQMGIPDQEEKKVTLQFSTVEKYFYEKQLQATVDVAERVMKSSDASTGGGSGVSGRSVGVRARRAMTRDLDSLNNLLQKLRAACNHPQVGASGMSRRRHGPGHHHVEGGSVTDRVLTMDEILDRLIDDAKGKCEEAQRITVLYTNGLASLMRLKSEAIGEGRLELIGQNSTDSMLKLLEKSVAYYQEVIDTTTANSSPTEAIGAAELRGSTGFHSNRVTIRDGTASLGWKLRRECNNASNLSGMSFNQAWCSFTFSGAAKIINSIKIRPILALPDLVGHANADGWTILRPKDCVLQMSSAAVGGEFVDIHRFTLSDEKHDGGWREVSNFFSPSRSKMWRMVIESYYNPAGGSHQGPDLYFTGIDVILFEPEIAPDNLQCLHTLTNGAIVRSSLMQESGGKTGGDNGGNTCNGDNAGDEGSTMSSTRETIKSMEEEAEALSSNYLAHARAVHERSHAKLQFAIEAREVAERDLDSLSDGSNPWYQDLLAWCATQGSEGDKRMLCEMVRNSLSSHQATTQNTYQRLEVRNKNSSMAKLEHCLVRRGQFAEFTSVDGLNVAFAMRIQQGEAELNLKKDEDMVTCIRTVSDLSSKPSDREVFENSHCKRCRKDWNQKGPVCGHCHLEDTIVKLTKLSNDPELDCVCRSIQRFIQQRISSTKRNTTAGNGEAGFLQSLHQRAIRFFELLDKRRHEIAAAKMKWKSHFDLMSDIDELQQCKQTSRLLRSDDNISELTEQEAAVIIDPNNIVAEIMENELKQASAQRELRIHKDSLRYLKNQRKAAQSTSSGEAAASAPDSCAVCLSDLQGERSVLRCGHCFHQECLERLVSRSGGGSVVRCPMRCRVTTRREDVFLATDMRKDDGSKQRRRVNGQYGVKVDRLVGDVLDMIDAGERGIVFSQWEDMLDVVATALSKNEVTYIRPRSGRRFGDDIKRYKGGDYPVLLMNVKNGAEGLTIVEANHVYMLEPLLNSGLDVQAISRVSRIGQQQKTFVHRYVVDGTVEVNIDKIRMERQANHFEDDILEQQKHGIKGGGIDGGFDVSELHQLFG